MTKEYLIGNLYTALMWIIAATIVTFVAYFSTDNKPKEYKILRYLIFTFLIIIEIIIAICLLK